MVAALALGVVIMAAAATASSGAASDRRWVIMMVFLFLMGSAFETAAALGFVDAQAVGRDARVQKFLLGRDADQRTAPGDQHRLAQLVIPPPESQAHAL